uniref:DUF19 domain-containing protein n=1 Tax=Biomphalaria glabrata TaxID=6526 RepID=A0A2C9K9Q9_BIOGL
MLAPTFGFEAMCSKSYFVYKDWTTNAIPEMELPHQRHIRLRSKITMDIYCFIITISVLVCCTVDVFCQNSNLDQYCFNKIQRGKRPVLTKLGFWNFILICPEDYMSDENQLSSCERSISYSQCVTKATTKYSNNMKFRDTTFNSSCRAMLEYSNCLKEAYVKCNSTYEYLFDYYYARIGSKGEGVTGVTP